MEKNKVVVIEILASLTFIVTGLFVWWCSQQLVWIQIYPPPLAKQFIDIAPFFFWGFDILFILDALRRNIIKELRRNFW